MPPKKRARVSQATSPAATDQHKTPTPAAQSPSKADEDVLNDPWTDEETIGLFKGVIKWKPTGLWRKLATLYDLEALDEREDARQLSDISDPDSAPNSASDSESASDDMYSLANNKIHKAPFALPSDDEVIEDLAWKRRFRSEKEERDAGSESPALLPEVNMDREAPVGFVRLLRAEAPSEEPASSPEPEEEEKRPRGRPKGSTSARAGAQAPKGEKRRSTRQAVEEEDEEDEDESEEGDDDDEEDEEDDDEDESSEEEDEDGSEETTPAPRSNRGGRGRGRPARGGSSGNARGRPRKK